MAPGRCLYNRQEGGGGPWWFLKGGGDLRSAEGEKKCEFVLGSLREIGDPGFVPTGGERSGTDVGLGEWLNQNIIRVAKPCPGRLPVQEKTGLLGHQLGVVD